MKKNIFISKSNKKQKMLYLFLIGLAIISFIVGILFVFLISKDNLTYIKDNIVLFFDNNSISISSFFKCLFNNFIYLIIIWILGISIVGIPLVLFMFIFKCFIFGFSFSSLFYSFGFKAIILSIFNLFINKFLYIVILLLLSFYSISFSLKLFRFLFFKKNINFKESFKKYSHILLISLIVAFFISLYEGFISIYIVNFFYN